MTISWKMTIIDIIVAGRQSTKWFNSLKDRIPNYEQIHGSSPWHKHSPTLQFTLDPKQKRAIKKKKRKVYVLWADRVAKTKLPMIVRVSASICSRNPHPQKGCSFFCFFGERGWGIVNKRKKKNERKEISGFERDDLVVTSQRCVKPNMSTFCS